MARVVINNPALPRSKSPHSNAVRVGNLIFISGIPGYDENVKVPQGDFAAQMRYALNNVKATLEYAGSSIDGRESEHLYGPPR
jgi:2-iminobutanoate/2-iminopropanoate deaminase